MKSLIVAGTRPEIIKLSPIMKEMEDQGEEYIFVSTGQHYSVFLFQDFLRELELRQPDFNLEVGSGMQGEQTAKMLTGLEKIIDKEKLDIVIAQGDTNSVLAAALAAIKLHVPFGHVEAGLRSFDRFMPEEINRVLADHCSEILFAPTEKSALNLTNEGILTEKIHIVGNTIVDAAKQNLKLAKKRAVFLEDFPRKFLLLTLHRAENVDELRNLNGIMDAILNIEENIIFPIHPRTKNMLQKNGLLDKFNGKRNIFLTEPLGYLDFLLLLSKARVVLTDSGGVQEEAVILKTPCITLRTTTERPETIEAGGNVLAGIETKSILETLESILENKERYNRMKAASNPIGDGKTAKRIVRILIEKYEKGEFRMISSNLIHSSIHREILPVENNMFGKKIAELPFKVVRLFQDGKEVYPIGNRELKNGQVLEILKEVPTRVCEDRNGK